MPRQTVIAFPVALACVSVCVRLNRSGAAAWNGCEETADGDWLTTSTLNSTHTRVFIAFENDSIITTWLG